jgi:hypothetical protein
MEEEILTDTLLRQYLLRRVDDEERQRIEKLFMTDSRARDRVLIAEQELIEDYLEDSLTTGDKQVFLSHYARTPEQRRKLRINKSIKHWAVTEAEATPISSSVWSRFLESLRLRPAFVVPIAVAILIAIVIAYVWLNRRMEYWAIQKEVAQLNTPASLGQNPRHMVSLSLAPVTVRNGEEQNQVTKSVDTQVVELHLLTIQTERYPIYRAVLLRVGENEPIVTIDEVKAENGNPIRLRLLARILSNGSYRIKLIGIAPDGSAVPVEEYTFSVD